MQRSFLLMAALLLFAGPSEGRTWIVAPDGSGDFVRIQEAIDAAVSGDEILVRPGTYVEILDTRGKVLDLIGEGGAAGTIVDADEQGSALTIPFTPGGTPLIRGLCFTNGIGTILRAPVPDGRVGGGVWIEVAFPLFEECWFTANRANTGGGVFVLSGAPVFVRCRFDGNAAGVGGGIALEHDGGVHLEECEITGNEAVFGGGISLFHSRLVVESCRISGNSAAEGGAVWILERGPGLVRIGQSILSGNYADRAGAIAIREADLAVEAATIAGNATGPAGGTLEIADASVGLETTIVGGNDSGVAILCTGTEPLLECVVLWDRTVGGEGCGTGDRVLRADPLFCGAETGDYTLRPDSPCLPGQGLPGCGLIGALGIGCDGPVAVEPIRWGAWKALFR